MNYDDIFPQGLPLTVLGKNVLKFRLHKNNFNSLNSMSDTIHFITWGWLYLSLGFLFWAMIIAPLFPIGMGLWAIYTFALLYLHQKSPKKRWQNIAYGILILILLLTITIYVLGTWQRFTQAFPVILSGNLIGSICYWFIRKRQ